MTFHCPVLKMTVFTQFCGQLSRPDKFSFAFTTSHVYLSLHVHRALFGNLKDAHEDVQRKPRAKFFAKRKIKKNMGDQRQSLS